MVQHSSNVGLVQDARNVDLVQHSSNVGLVQDARIVDLVQHSSIFDFILYSSNVNLAWHANTVNLVQQVVPHGEHKVTDAIYWMKYLYLKKKYLHDDSATRNFFV